MKMARLAIWVVVTLFAFLPSATAAVEVRDKIPFGLNRVVEFIENRAVEVDVEIFDGPPSDPASWGTGQFNPELREGEGVKAFFLNRLGTERFWGKPEGEFIAYLSIYGSPPGSPVKTQLQAFQSPTPVRMVGGKMVEEDCRRLYEECLQAVNLDFGWIPIRVDGFRWVDTGFWDTRLDDPTALVEVSTIGTSRTGAPKGCSYEERFGNGEAYIGLRELMGWKEGLGTFIRFYGDEDRTAESSLTVTHTFAPPVAITGVVICPGQSKAASLTSTTAPTPLPHIRIRILSPAGEKVALLEEMDVVGGSPTATHRVPLSTQGVGWLELPTGASGFFRLAPK